MKWYKPGILILSLIIASNFLGCNKKAATQEKQMITLKSWMTGSFNSQEQAEADTNFFNIHLEMVQIWKEQTDATWLYVEQAAAWSLDKPYRQRVYRVSKMAKGKLESAVFTFNNPLRFAGVYNEPLPLSQLTPDSLTERSGCAIILEYNDGFFSGSTVEQNCQSNLRGATYATSEVQIEKNRVTSWDRGFDAEGAQVWGAVTGPYELKKVKDYN